MATEMGPMAEHVQRRWRDGQAPDGDVIVFGDGRLSVVRFCTTESWSRADEILRATEWPVRR
jgi:hypothetical protein